MKRCVASVLSLVLILLLVGCSRTVPTGELLKEEDDVLIELSESGISVNGDTASTDPADAVYTACDIVYYEEGKDFTYGEGAPEEAHSAEEAASHTVIHITQPGRYILSGTLSKGQVAVDLGEDAGNDPNAVVTLILNGLDISCSVAPAVIFYNVYECGSKDEASAGETVDTSAAGANVIISDGTTNTVTGSYVARIYKPDTVVLNEDGTEVEDAKKLHKYDAAFYSRMSMNVTGGKEGNGALYINAENEGLDSELHLTINGGDINISSGNDGINTNEDNISVTTINGGNLHIQVTGETGEGDGIDSNGWLVINGGTVTAFACGDSQDSGIDSDKGIHINGGFVIASGHMLDRIEDGGVNYAVFQFAQTQSGKESYELKSADGKSVLSITPPNRFSNLLVAADSLTTGEYSFRKEDTQLVYSGTGTAMMSGGGPKPDRRPPDGFEMHPEGFENPEDGWTPPDDRVFPEPPDMPDGKFPESLPMDGKRSQTNRQPYGESSADFTVRDGGNYFSFVSPYTS